MKLVYDYDVDKGPKYKAFTKPPDVGTVLELDGFFHKVYKISKTPKGLIKIHLLQSCMSREEAEKMKLP